MGGGKLNACRRLLFSLTAPRLAHITGGEAAVFSPQETQGMRNLLFVLTAAAVAASPLLAGSTAVAQLSKDDVKWINQCIADNKGGAAEGVIRKYCMCMNEKMDDNESKSITQWEKSHPTERAACDKESGWK